MGENVEESFARLELLEKIARIALESTQSPSSSLPVPYDDSIDVSRPCDAIECIELDAFAKRAYTQVLLSVIDYSRN